MIRISRRSLLAAGGGALAGAVMGGYASPGIGGLRFSTVDAYARALARRELSAREAVDEAISRIETLDANLNAVVVRDFERARAAALDADRALARGDHRALLGIPMTVKESFDIEGLPTTLGQPAERDRIAQDDAIAVKRLKDAGAIILGKTNVPLKLGDWQSYNDIHGTTRNPWNPARTPGGSSGGAAAALAAGFVPMELGSDFGGSIRVPAHFCGVYGHKPTAGPVAGVVPLSVFGPMARSAFDLAPLLDILLGPGSLGTAEDPRLPFLPQRHSRLEDFRVLMVDSHSLLPTSSEVVAALHQRAQALEKAGVLVQRTSDLLPDLASLGRQHICFVSQYIPEKYKYSQYYEGPVTEEVVSAINQARVRIAAQWHALFQTFDVLLCPAMPTVAFPHDHAEPQRSRRIQVDGRDVPYIDQVIWSGIATFTGLPSTVAPVGLSSEGLPIGVQILGPFLEDYTTIAFARMMEERFGGFQEIGRAHV